MRRFLFVSCLTFFAISPASADITHAIKSSISLTVDGAGSISTRLPSTMAVSGSNVDLDTAPVLGTLSSGTALGYTPGAYSITTAGDSFSYTESYIEGDDVPTVLSTTVTSGVVPALPVFGSNTTTAGGVAGTLAGTLATDGAMTITAGGAGTTAIGQVIQELTIK
ncbi:hypothetical protein [uncultured Mediterranean phage uvDeep-CGR2-KM19-C184]|nr:hypothetical protein [uncultured Mediterranean phage uvDeep-CGR2-KM19-C184]